jgi:hypothetical protein
MYDDPKTAPANPRLLHRMGNEAAQKLALQRFPHLFDPNLARRRWLEGSGGEVWIPGGSDDVLAIDNVVDAEPVEPGRPTPDAPLRLAVAAKLAFPDGGVTAVSLRREAKAGRLLIERIAGKDFTTLKHIERMRDQCRDQAREPVCGSNQKNVTQAAGSSAAQHGSSVTERVKSARAALEATAKALNAPLLTTSPANTKRREKAVVIPLKF